MKKKWLCYLLICAVILQYEPMEVQAAGKGIEITNVSGSSLNVAPGSSFSLRSSTNTKYLKFSSSKKQVATVNSKGIISAKKKGKTVVTIRNKKTDAKKKVKVSVKSPKGYKITNVAGTYQDHVDVTLTAKSGYKVYYSTNGNLKKKQVIGSAQSKEFTFDETTTLTIYVFKNKEKITSASKQKNQAFYTYTIVSGVSDTEDVAEQTENTAMVPGTETHPTEETSTSVSGTEEKPTTEKPTIEQPTTEKPTTEKPTTEKPTTEKPTTEKPTTEKPTTEKPTEEKPTTEKPTTEKPTIEQPTTEKPTEEKPTTEKPTTEKPTTEKPTTEKPTTEKPTTEQPTTEEGELVEEATPECEFTATDSNAGRLTNVTTNQIYSVDNGETWKNITRVSYSGVQITGVTPEYGIQIKTLGNGVTTSDSKVQYIEVEKAETPNLDAVQPDETTTYGSIPLTRDYEYRVINAGGMGQNRWMQANGTINVKPGTYEIRVKASGTVLASDIQTIVIVEYNSDISTEKPTTEKPTTEKPTTEKPTTEKPTTEEPTTEKPTTEEPTTEKPTTEEPTTEVPEGVTKAEVSEEKVEIVMGKAPSDKLTYKNTAGTEILSVSKKNKVTISAGGTYRITAASSGEVSGRIEVDVEADVNIILAGVNLTSGDTDGVFTIKKKVTGAVVTLEDGTVNTLKDTAAIGTETDETTGETTTVYPDGAFVSKQAPTVIQGTGKLVVSSNLGTGVKATGNLTIKDAKIEVSSAGNNGITAKNALIISGAELNVTSDGDGIKTTTPDDTTDTTLGNIKMENTKLTVKSKEDGIQAYRDAEIKNCDMDITASKDSSKLTTVEGETKDSFKGIKADTLSISGGNYTINAGSDKGLKADTLVSIKGGTFAITSTDDGIHSDNNVLIDGADTDITISTGDDGIHANNELTINNGKVNVTKSYEGLEALNIIVNGGDIKVVASDDGVNIAGGKDSSGATGGDQFGPGGRPGQGGFGGGETVIDGALTVTDGKLTVVAGGDGLDSNGSINITGGEVYVFGPESGANGVFDCNGTFKISGGTVVGAGTANMQVNPTMEGEQSYVTFSTSGNAGTKVTLKDASGTELISFTPEVKYGYVMVTTDKVKSGETYQLYINNSQSGSATAGSSSGGSQGGGFGQW